jgi:hydrogenase maturation protein HypF
MKLEAAAAAGTAETWDLAFLQDSECELLSGRALMETAFGLLEETGAGDRQAVCDIAASFQYNLARGIAKMAICAAEHDGVKKIALSGGVAYNHTIRETIRREVIARGFSCIINNEYPLGDGCVSYGQCLYAGKVLSQQR